MIRAEIVADSINEAGVRLTTFECVCPKRIVAQFNTHGMIRRDSASVRAIPTIRVMEQVQSNPYLPPQWNYRQRGMQPSGPMSPEHAAEATRIEHNMRRSMLRYVGQLEAINCAKEDANAYLEPWMWTTIVATATEWDNYFALRDHEEAQSAHAILARAMKAAMGESRPVLRDTRATLQEVDLWHLPYVTDAERIEVDWQVLPLISSARCAGVSYYRQGAHGEIEREIERGRELVRKRHWSPVEQPSRAMPNHLFYGPFRGFKPMRKFYGGESGSSTHGTREDAPWVTR